MVSSSNGERLLLLYFKVLLLQVLIFLCWKTSLKCYFKCPNFYTPNEMAEYERTHGKHQCITNKMQKNTNLYKNIDYQTVYHENVSFEWHLESGIPAKNEKLLGCFKIKSFFIIYLVRANRFTVCFLLSFQPSRKY